MATLWRLLRLAAPLKGPILLAALVGFLTVGAGVGLMATSAYLISAAALHPSVAALGVAIVGVRFFGIARGIFRYAERYVSHHVALTLLARMRVWFYAAVEPLAPARLLGYRSGDLLDRVVADVNSLQDFYLRVLAPPLVAALVAALMWLLLGAFNPLFAATLLLFYLLAAVGVPLLTHLLGRELGAEIVRVRGALAAQLIDGIGGLAEIVAFGQEERTLGEVAALNRRLIGLQRRMAWVNGLQSALGSVLTNLAALTMLLAAIPLVRAGQLDGVYLALLVLATLASFEAIAPLPLAAQQLGGHLAAARRLFEIVDAQPAVADRAAAGAQPADYSIIVRGLTFRYNPTDPPALSDLSFTLPQGRTLALVGPSGAGKSTVAHLLTRFWDYDQGEILLGGHDLRDYRQDDVRALIGVVSQQTQLFNTSIRRNLLIARPAATDDELIAATKEAQLYDFISALPQGLDTTIGEQGLLLSGGERQRLAIARAFLKNAPILILDEPTANLDTMTERAIMQALSRLAAGRTTLLITHRLNGLELADEIVVLRAGRVVERGAERELLAREGLYWRLWQQQIPMLAARSA